MGDFDLGNRASRYSLGDFRLQLEPEIEAQIRRIQAGQTAPRFRQLILHPNWQSFSQSQLELMLSQPQPRPTPSTPARGPATPRPGQVGDVMRAIWALQPVQQAANRLLGDAERNLRREWNQANAGERALMITAATMVAGTALTGLMANEPTRELLLDFVDGRDVPVPGVRGLTIQMRGRGRGAGAGLSNIGGSGLSIRGGAQATNSGGAQWDVNVALDLTQLVPQLR